MDPANGRSLTDVSTAEEREQAFWTFFRGQVADDGSSRVLMLGYRAHLTAWMIWCRDHGISALSASAQDVRSYRRSLAAEGVDPPLMMHKLLVMRRFYHSVVSFHLRKDNPALGIYPFHGC